MAAAGRIVIIEDGKNSSWRAARGRLIRSAAPFDRIHVDVLDESTTIRIGLDIETGPDATAKTRQIVTVHVLNASRLLAATGNHASVALKLAIHDNDVLTGRIQPASI